ncbi:MAG: BppU family phage baseplate upper protein [Bacillota bacterium]|nr:BppU family phage baseplate upper protein [Bacillota bacterium]
MNYKEFNIALPIKANNVVLIEGLVQYDTANIVNARLMHGTEPFDFTGYTEVFMEILKPDGTHIQACATGDPEIDNNNNPYTIQIVDPEEGRVTFTLSGQATLLTGTHFGQLTIMGDGEALSTARFNYYVGDTVANDTDPDDVVSSNDYASLRNMIAQNSLIATEELVRVDAETQRELAEDEREARVQEIIDYITEYLQNAVGYVEQTADYMEAAERFAELAQNPSAEIMASLISELNLASEEYVDTSIENAAADHDGGTYATVNKLMQFRRGLDADIPELEEGEPGWSTDAETLYVGGANGPVPINGTFVASLTEPERHDILWIDLSAGASIKYYDGSAWQPTATATFS